MEKVLKAVAGWSAGKHNRGNVADWYAAFTGLKVMGDTILADMARQMRSILGITSVPSAAVLAGQPNPSND
jgi:hypothetical protein